MISNKLFSYFRNNWREWIITVIIFIIGSIAEIYEKGMYVGTLVISGILMVIVLSVVVWDFVICIFKKHRLGYEWFILILAACLYSALLIMMEEIKILKTVIIFSTSFSFVFLIFFKLRELFTKSK